MKDKFNMFLASLSINSLNNKIKNIMSYGIKVSIILMLISVLFLSLYIQFKYPTYLYILGTYLFKATTIFIVVFFIDALCFDKLLQEKK